MSTRVPYESKYKRHVMVEQLLVQMDFKKIQQYMTRENWTWSTYSIDAQENMHAEPDAVPSRQHFELSVHDHLGWAPIPRDSTEDYDLDELRNKEDGFSVSGGGMNTLINKGKLYGWFGYTADFTVNDGLDYVSSGLGTGKSNKNEQLKNVVQHLLQSLLKKTVIAEAAGDQLYKLKLRETLYVVREQERGDRRDYSVTELVGNIAEIHIDQYLDQRNGVLDL